jgi:hypothetical protein
LYWFEIPIYLVPVGSEILFFTVVATIATVVATVAAVVATVAAVVAKVATE